MKLLIEMWALHNYTVLVVTDCQSLSENLSILPIFSRGIWNVPYITGVYAIKRSVLENLETRPNYIYRLYDADMAMTTNMRQKVTVLFHVL